MPKLIVPEEKLVSGQGSERSIKGDAAATASATKIGQLQANEGAEAVAGGAKIGTIMRTQAAEGIADQGRQVGDLIGKNAASAAASYASIGKTAMEAGQSVMAQGQAMFNKASEAMSSYIERSKGAVSDARYNNTFSSASKEFNQQAMDRMNKPYDDNGQPTFASLSADIGAIAEGVKNKYGAQLSNDPEASQKFNATFTNMSTNHQISAMKESRQQQVEYSKGALVNFLNTNTTNALSDADRSTLPAYVAQSNAQIDSAYKNGYITYEQGVQLKDKNRHDINYGSIETLAQKNPNAVFDMLGMNPNVPGQTDAQLGITPMERAKLVDVTTKRINAQRISDRTRIAEEKAIVNEQQVFNKENLELGVAQGSVTDAEVDASYNSGKISHTQMTNLKEKIITNNSKGLNKAQTRQNISTDISNGKLVAGRYTPNAINDHYKNQIETSGAAELFDTKQPMDRARLAAQYRAPVPGFASELDSIAKGGSPEQIVKAAEAYRYVSTKSPLAVSGLNKQTSAYYSTINSQLKYGNVDPSKAIERANALVFEAKDEDHRIRRNESDNKDSPFSPAKIDSTIASMKWGDDSGPGSYSNLKHTFGPRDKISEFAKTQITRQLRDAYVLTGSYEAAKEMVQNESQGVYGTSGMNTVSQWTRDNSTLMFAPPEATYGPGTATNYNSTEMRSNMEHDVSGMLVKGDFADQSNIRPEQIMVGSGEFTARQIGNAKYSMYYVDDAGQEHPIVDPKTGQAQFWSPDANYISDYRTQQVEKQFNSAKRVQDMNKIIEDHSIGGVVKGAVTGVVKGVIGDSKDQGVSSEARPGSQGNVINTALSFVGVNEQSDRQALGKVMSRMIGQSIDPATTPWCAAFVNTVLRANGQQGTSSLAARSFLNWGRPTNNPQQGDIVVMSRGSDPNKGHVGFYMGKDSNGNVLVLGGNQSDAVNVKAVSAGSVLSIRTSEQNGVPSQQSNEASIGTSTVAFNPSEVAGYRQAPSGEEVQQLYQNNTIPSMNNKALPVGIRQNNPGNVTKTGSRWPGEVPNNSSNFKEFSSAEDGIGAIVSNLKTNYTPKGFNTVEKVVKRWTATQKDWPSYIKNISEATGLQPNEKFDINTMQPRQLLNLIKAIIKQENGYNPYPDSVIMNGILRGN